MSLILKASKLSCRYFIFISVDFSEPCPCSPNPQPHPVFFILYHSSEESLQFCLLTINKKLKKVTKLFCTEKCLKNAGIALYLSLIFGFKNQSPTLVIELTDILTLQYTLFLEHAKHCGPTTREKGCSTVISGVTTAGETSSS